MRPNNITSDETGRFASIVPELGFGKSMVFAILTIAFWLVAHPYGGIWHDSIVYTVQALNVLYPDIYQGDVFFKYGSQTNYTIFPFAHAQLISLIGVDDSAFLLTIIGQVLFFAGSISLARHFLTPGQTLLFLIFFTTLPVYDNPVLYIFEVFATSRGISAGLSLLFLLYFLKNRVFTASLLIITALLLHPLIPLGVITIAVLLQRAKVILILISLGMIFLAIGYVLAIPPFSNPWLTLDTQWRELVVEHAPFLFIELWSSHDLNLLAFELFTILSARAYCTNRFRSLFSAMLLATAICLAVSLAGSLLSNALLIQLQTWRILLFVHVFSAMALAWLISVAWNKEHGKIVVLLYCANLLSLNALGGLPASAIHLFWVWSLRRNPSLPPVLLKGAYVILAQGILWYLLNTSLTDPQTVAYSADFVFANSIRYCLTESPLYITALLIALLQYSRHSQQAASRYLGIALAVVAPFSVYYFDQRFRNETWVSGNAEPYITLRKEIPESATVYCEAGLQTGWFLIRRQHYMSTYQSSGIVFNRKTAIETTRRADLIFNAGLRNGVLIRYGTKPGYAVLPETTTESFDDLCQDPELDYIVTSDKNLPKSPSKIIDTEGSKIYIYNCSLPRPHGEPRS